MKMPKLARFLPSWKNAALALLSAILLILAFPDYSYSPIELVALFPLLWAIERGNRSAAASFIIGWLWGVVFFTGTCWWLTFAPVHYAGFPSWLAYLLLFCLTAIVGIFPGIFSMIMSVFVKRFGRLAIVVAPVVWVFSEFLRYWVTGNDWNALGYAAFENEKILPYASFGGVLLCSFVLAFANVYCGIVIYFLGRFWGRAIQKFFSNIGRLNRNEKADFVGPQDQKGSDVAERIFIGVLILQASSFLFSFVWSFIFSEPTKPRAASPTATVVAIQPNVPMSGLTYEKWKSLRDKHVQLAESALNQLTTDHRPPTTVIFPESPMNFAYEEDEEFRDFVHAFAAKNNVNVLFNSAEPDAKNNKYFNSAVLVNTDGKEMAQYDKIYLLPFGEAVPAPLQSVVPAFVGSFSYGNEYDLLPLGDAKAGVMICFESHFGELSREYVRNGADVLIEMTNDGYLGPTPVLRQHLANAVFRAVETNRPVLRVTNVGVTAYVNERGVVRDAAETYTEDSRIWSVSKSDGSQTFYVKYGEWFAWLCSIVSIVSLAISLRSKRT